MHQRIVILGFMGCGKTTVARVLARQLEASHIDLDSFIYDREGRSPAEIIKEDGEERFREVETLALRDVLQDSDARVIALGGGTWTIAANRTLIALHDCATVWLDAPFDLCWTRITNTQTDRPLAPNREAALSRYQSRRADYELGQRRLEVHESDNAEALANQILIET
jgi:shikimate kinase